MNSVYWSPGFMRRRWVLSITRCTACGFAFNFLHGKRPSMAASLNGLDWRFRCPDCHARTTFNLRNTNTEAGLPVYSDAARFTYFVVMLPIAVALMTVLVTFVLNFGFFQAFPLEFTVILDVVLVMEFSCMGICYWYYRNRLEFERLG